MDTLSVTKKSIFVPMKHKAHIPIALLMLLITAAILINQYGILRMSHNYKKTEFLAIVDQAMKKAVKEIDYELFDQCVMHNSDTAFRNETLLYFEDLKTRSKQNTTNSHYNDLEEIDRYESFMLRYLVESTDMFDYQALDVKFVDSVIRSCFQHFAIEASYELGLYCPLESNFLFQTTGKYEQELLKDGVRFEVFSPQKGTIPCYDQIIVYFPELDAWIAKQNHKNYFLKSIICLIFLSCILLMFIIIKRDRELSELKHSLVNNMTHELKTPISTISLACEALEDTNIEKDANLINTYIRIIKEENEKNKELIECVLNIVRTTKKVQVNYEDTYINQSLKTIVSMHQLPAQKKKAHISLQLDAENDLVCADKIHIGNALSNILDNALKYSRENPEIVISTRNNSEHTITISIRDNGMGIRKKDQKRIFDEFFRIDTGNIHNVKGHGLGLHYVKQVIEFHHGKINVDSKLNEGSTFTITLPLKKFNTN